MTRPQTTVLAALARAPRLRSRRSVPRLLQRRRRAACSSPHARWTAESTRLAHTLRALGVRPRRPGRDAAREPRRAGHQLLRGAEARRGPGADQHRVQGRVPAPPARRLRREGVHRAGRLRVARGRGRRRRARRPTLDALHHRRPARRGHRRRARRSSWQDALAAGRDDADRRRRRCGPAISRASSTPRARPVRRKGCMLPHNYIVEPRRPDRARVGAPRRRHRAHAAAAVPLQRDLGVRRRHAARRRAAR